MLRKATKKKPITIVSGQNPGMQRLLAFEKSFWWSTKRFGYYFGQYRNQWGGDSGKRDRGGGGSKRVEIEGRRRSGGVNGKRKRTEKKSLSWVIIYALVKPQRPENFCESAGSSSNIIDVKWIDGLGYWWWTANKKSFVRFHPILFSRLSLQSQLKKRQLVDFLLDFRFTLFISTSNEFIRAHLVHAMGRTGNN